MLQCLPPLLLLSPAPSSLLLLPAKEKGRKEVRSRREKERGEERREGKRDHVVFIVIDIGFFKGNPDPHSFGGVFD